MGYGSRVKSARLCGMLDVYQIANCTRIFESNNLTRRDEILLLTCLSGLLFVQFTPPNGPMFDASCELNMLT